MTICNICRRDIVGDYCTNCLPHTTCPKCGHPLEMLDEPSARCNNCRLQGWPLALDHPICPTAVCRQPMNWSDDQQTLTCTSCHRTGTLYRGMQ